MTPEALKKIVKQVPPNYYARGVRNNIFQRYWHGRKWRILKEFLPKINGQILDIGCADEQQLPKLPAFYLRPKLRVLIIILKQ